MSGIPKKFLILALVLPVAALLGYLLAGPLDYTSIAVYALILSVILVPLVIQHHHILTILCLNASIDIFFLPGKPHLWMLVATASLGITILGRILNKEERLVFVPSVALTLGAMVLVAIITAKFTGGLGMRVLGDANYGGKRYVYIILAMVVFLAVSLQRVPLEKAPLYMGLYFLANLTSLASNLIYLAGPGLWWLYLFFPVDYAMSQAYEDYGVLGVQVRYSRLAGFAPAAQAVLCFLLARGGIRSLFDMTKPWRMGVAIVTVGFSLLSGFRSSLLLMAMILAIQFCLEGLLRTRLFLVMILGGILGFMALIPLARHLPVSAQRTLSMLPLDVDPIVRADAEGSTDWRIQMWEVVVQQIPRYFWFGKGYSTSATDLYLATESQRRGLAKDYELTLLAGDYHSGPLSVIIPFGIWGVLAFLAFLVAIARVLYCNYRYGDPALKSANTLLFSYYLAKVVFFFGAFGQIHTELGTLAGLVGLSICLNHGVRQRQTAIEPSRKPGAVPALSPARWRPAFKSAAASSGR